MLNGGGCDLLEKLYLCGVNNNTVNEWYVIECVVICLKNCTFVVSTTTALQQAEEANVL